MKQFFSKVAVVAIVAVSLASSAFAATPDDAKAYASSIGDKVLKILNAPNTTPAQHMDKLEAMFVDVVDVEWVGRFVLGRYWKDLTPEQQKSYLEAYRVFLIKHYTSRFADYSGETFNLSQAREERAGEFFVRMEIQRPAGQAPIVVDYRMRETAGKFKVFDIIVEGVSLITTQRSEFGAVVERKGIDDLTAKLKKKTEALNQEMAAKK